ncbi:DUF6439 family protein [Okeania sp.]|uniref:DUF6439 family protein n=1 Tax=Okeania sp. TaxID=3100323 RepID=UPI002B4B0DBB|nr:DUF6439 family protein [Okeania sp.]MEB3341902.1 DUF6439 family protein [Okeania sp.]
MLHPNSTPLINQVHSSSHIDLQQYSTLELAQALAERLAIPERDWHRLKSNRQVRALELTIAAVVFLIQGQPTEAIARLNQAIRWLDRSISAPPCPTHGSQKN